jgi:hypothetical protein
VDYLLEKRLVKLIITACLLFFIILLIFEIFEVNKRKEYQYEIEFFQHYLSSYYGLNSTIISDFTEVFDMLNKNRPDIAKEISPLEIIAIGQKETNFRNIKGDGDDSLGFFQVQEPTYWFVKNMHEDLFYEIEFLGLPWIWDNVRVRPDAQLLSSILYLHYLKDKFSEDYAFSHYNGGNIYYQQDIMSIMIKIKDQFKQFRKDKERNYND